MSDNIDTIDWNSFVYYDESSPTGLRWKVDRMSGRNLKIIQAKAGSPAGSLFLKQYYRLKLNNKSYLCHRIIWKLFNNGSLGNLQVDHIDGNPSNNKYSNLRKVTNKENSHNTRKHKSNTSGVSCVVRQEWSGYTYWVVYWTDFKTSKRKYKCFSVKKLGDDAAFSMACSYREQMLDEQRKQGAYYTERHGVSLT